ncbi:DUF885 family protein [Sphingomonas sp. DT-204]|uniref:DUF885 family protein n=1 Tax=Sphingomonas sp. DT-204 TaxID=3396166 RepID=UPI003F19B05B
MIGAGAPTTRRTLLAGVGATLATVTVPAAAADRDDRRLRALLDGLDALPSPAARLARLRAFRGDRLSPSAALDLHCIREGLAIDTRIAEIMPFGRLGRSPYSVTPTSGAWRDPDGADAADRIAADTRAVRAEAAAGIILPRALLDRTAAAVAKAADGAERAAATALREQAALLSSLAPRAGDTPGMWRLPNGAEYYALLLDRQFGFAGDGAAAHRRFLAKAEELTRAADALLRRLGRREGSVGERIAAAFRDPAHLYRDDDASRTRADADMNRILVSARARVPALIGPVPPECLNVAVRRMSPADEAARRGGYRELPTPDGRPGGYFVDLGDIRRRPSWSLGSVVHHELIPGHMIQLPMEARAAPHPLRLGYAPAFAEGWAIHAEQLMARDGADAGDDLMLLGHIHWLLFRIVRAVIDTGVHAERWSVSEARQKLRMMQGEPAFFAAFDQDVDRICLEPAVRAGEAEAWLALAEAGAGRSGATLRRFHQAVLVHGRVRRSAIGLHGGD